MITIDDVVIPDTVPALESYCLSLIEADLEAEAIPVIEKIIAERRRKHLGETATIRWMEQLAFCLRKVGRAEASAEVFQQVHDEWIKRYGPKHPALIFTQRRLAIGLADAGNFEKATVALRLAAANATEAHGGSSVAAATCYSRLLECLRKLERWSEVVEIGRAYLDNCRDSRADDWREQLISILRSISHAYRKLGDAEQAVAFLEGAVHYGRLQWGEADTRVMRDLRWLSRCYLYKGDVSRSLELLKHVLMIHTSTHGANHLSTLAVARELKNRCAKVKKRLGYARRKAQKTQR